MVHQMLQLNKMQETLKNMNILLMHLAEFTGFVIKIVGQAQNTSIVPLVSALDVWH